MKLVVCLGNPGKQYEKTRHNAGFLIGDAIQSGYPESSCQSKFNARVSELLFLDEKVIFLYPQSFMNLSGQSVQAAMSFYKLSRSDLLVIYDDFDIPIGTMRFRLKGGAGTHNGMRSIVSLIGNGDFCRLRIGIGPLPPSWKVADFVLSSFSSDEINQILDCSLAARKSVEAWIKGDLDRATRLAASAPKD